MKNKKKKKYEFSKLVLSFVMGLFFIVAFFGMALIGMMTFTMLKAHSFSTLSVIATALGALFTFVATPTSVSIGYYLWKSKNENINKYGKGTGITKDVTKEMINELEHIGEANPLNEVTKYE